MKCHKCRGSLEKTKTNKVFEDNILVENISAYRCKGCGELLFDEVSYNKTLKAIKSVKRKIPQKVLSKIKMVMA